MHNARSNSEDSDVLRVTLANVPSDVDKDRIGWQVDCFSSSIKCALGLTRRERSERHSAGASSLPLPPNAVPAFARAPIIGPFHRRTTISRTSTCRACDATWASAFPISATVRFVHAQTAT